MDGNETPEAITKALSHEMRRRIVRLIGKRKAACSPKEASVKLDEPLSQVSYHVRELAQAGLLNQVRTRQVRGSLQHFYLLDPSSAKLPAVVAVINGTT